MINFRIIHLEYSKNMSDNNTKPIIECHNLVCCMPTSYSHVLLGIQLSQSDKHSGILAFTHVRGKVNVLPVHVMRRIILDSNSQQRKRKLDKIENIFIADNEYCCNITE